MVPSDKPFKSCLKGLFFFSQKRKKTCRKETQVQASSEKVMCLVLFWVTFPYCQSYSRGRLQSAVRKYSNYWAHFGIDPVNRLSLAQNGLGICSTMTGLGSQKSSFTIFERYFPALLPSSQGKSKRTASAFVRTASWMVKLKKMRRFSVKSSLMKKKHQMAGKHCNI